MTDHKVSVHVSPCSLQIRRGGSATYTIKVNRPPTTGTALNIQIEPQCPDGSVEVLPNRVQFSHLNWRVSQTVRVEATTKSRLHCVNIKHRIVRSSDRIYPVNLEIPTVFALFLQKDAVFYYSFGAGTTGCLSDPAMRCRYEPYLSHYTWLYPIHVACGDAHVAFVDVNGQVYCIGQASQLGQGKKCATSHTPVLVESISTHSVTHIACGDTHTICTTSMGCVYGWGSNSQFQLGLERSQAEILEPRLISHELNAATVAAAANHSFLLTQHGQLYSTGQNMAGQLGHGDTKPRKVMTLVESFQKHRVYSVSCGPYHTAALSNDVFTWGDGEHGRLGTGNLNLQRVPTVVPTLRNQKISQLVCGGAHTAAITSKHEVYTWGANTYGQLGHGTFTASKFPRRVRLLTGKKIQSIALGTWHSVALAKGGDVYSWGFGGEGQLGLGHDESVTLPMIIADVAGKGALSISCGAHFSIVTTAFREKNRKLETIQRRKSVLKTQTEKTRLRRCRTRARLKPTAPSQAPWTTERVTSVKQKAAPKAKKAKPVQVSEEFVQPVPVSYHSRGSIRWRLRHLNSSSRPSRQLRQPVEDTETETPAVLTRYRMERPKTATKRTRTPF